MNIFKMIIEIKIIKKNKLIFMIIKEKILRIQIIYKIKKIKFLICHLFKQIVIRIKKINLKITVVIK